MDKEDKNKRKQKWGELIEYITTEITSKKEGFTKEYVFNIIKKQVSKDLNTFDEELKIFRYSFWSYYVKEEGIMINDDLNLEKKTALLIHEYKHFSESDTAWYSPLKKESVDKEVLTALSKIAKIANEKLGGISLFSKKTKEDEFFKKMFE